MIEKLIRLEQLMTAPRALPSPIDANLDIAGLYCPSVPPEMAKISIISETNRNAGLCVRDRCVNWRGHCVLGVAVSIAAKPLLELQEEDLAACPIRNNCRWYKENGADVCSLCPALLHRELIQTMEMMTNGK
jgi:hypothetical protein